MHIDAAQPWGIQRTLRQQQAVGDDHHDIGGQCFEFSEHCRSAQRRRLVHRQLMAQRELLDRARSELFASAGGPVGLGVDRDNSMVAREQRREMAGGEIGRAGKDQAQRCAGDAASSRQEACSRCNLTSFWRMRRRFSGDR